MSPRAPPRSERCSHVLVMTVGVSRRDRDRGIGTRLLKHALNEGSSDEYIKDAYLHVQTNNDDAISFYKRFGFVEDVVVRNYYKRLDPPDAVILKLDNGRAVETGGDRWGDVRARRGKRGNGRRESIAMGSF